MFETNLAAWQVVLPLIGAPICALLPRKIVWYFVFAIMLGALAVSLGLYLQVHDHGMISYKMGGWEPPQGIEYRIDHLTVYMFMLVSSVGVIATLFAKNSVVNEIDSSKQSLFYVAYLLCFTGLQGIIATNDAFNIYVFLEISSLAMYALIAMGKDRRALTASFEYLILGSIGATFILISVGLLYMVTGTLNITDLSQRVVEHWDTNTVKTAMAFFLIGIALKIAVFPMHLWLTNAYTNAPSFVTAFIAATSTKVSLYVLVRIIWSVFGDKITFDGFNISALLLTLGAGGAVLASLMAIFQRNVKRMLAYSSVGQIGYILIGIGLGTKAGLASGLIHMVNHGVMKLGLFIGVGCVIYHIGRCRLVDFAGIAKTMPQTCFAIALLGLGLVGLPLTAGFVSKWYLLQAVAQEQQWVVFAAIIVSSVLGVVYLWRLIETCYFAVPKGNNDNITSFQSPVLMQAALWLCVFATFALGIFTSYTVGEATFIANMLFEGVQ